MDPPRGALVVGAAWITPIIPKHQLGAGGEAPRRPPNRQWRERGGGGGRGRKEEAGGRGIGTSRVGCKNACGGGRVAGAAL
jgi:hypothetical protein